MLIRQSEGEGNAPWMLAVVAFLVVLAFTAAPDNEGMITDSLSATGFYLVFTGNFVVRKSRRKGHRGSDSIGADRSSRATDSPARH